MRNALLCLVRLRRVCGFTWSGEERTVCWRAVARQYGPPGTRSHRAAPMALTPDLSLHPFAPVLRDDPCQTVEWPLLRLEGGARDPTVPQSPPSVTCLTTVTG